MENTFTLDRSLFEMLDGTDHSQLLYVRYVNAVKKFYGEEGSEHGVRIHYSNTDGRDLRIEGPYQRQKNSMRIIWRKNGTIHIRSRVASDKIKKLIEKYKIEAEVNENKDDNLYQNVSLKADPSSNVVEFLVEMTKEAHKVFSGD